MGSDRLVNALGALAVHAPPLIVVDSGTAITLDVVGADGAFEGGIIAFGARRSPGARGAALTGCGDSSKSGAAAVQ